MSWRGVLVWWLVWSAAGVAVIALPDNGPRLIAFSGEHGPGLLDAAGIIMLVVGSAALWWYLIRHRARLSATVASVRTLWTFAAGVGVGLVLASVAGDFSAWWVVGAGLLAALQIAMFATLARR
jgi:hypothetical protein